jgi:hypothetical protein
MNGEDILYDWSMEKMVEITLPKPDDFLKIKETLTRIGIASRKDNILTQSCHVLHKRGKYYIISFKEIFAIEGKESTLTLEDVARRNRIIGLLEDWGMCKVVRPEMIVNKASMSSIKVVAYKDRENWTLCSKYTIGKKRDVKP